MADSFKRSTVSVVIPNWNGSHWLPICLQALFRQTYPIEAVIVVDNGSTDDSLSWLSIHYPNIALIRFEVNLGFAAAVNAGIRKSRSKYVALLNTDTEVEKDWIKNLVQVLDTESDQVAAVCPLMLSLADRTKIDNAGDTFSWYGEAAKVGHGESARNFAPEREILLPSAGAALFRRSFFDDCGYFDDDFFAYLEDIDLGIRGRLMGYRYLLEPTSIVYHQSHGSNINYDFYIKLVTQNRLLVFWKNIPFWKRLKFIHRIAYGQLYYLLAFGHLKPVLSGYWGFVKHIPGAIAKHRTIRKKQVIDDREIDNLLLLNKPGEGLSHHFRKLFKRVFEK